MFFEVTRRSLGETTFTLNTPAYSGGTIDVYINGVKKKPESYIQEGAVITLHTAPKNNHKVTLYWEGEDGRKRYKEQTEITSTETSDAEGDG